MVLGDVLRYTFPKNLRFDKPSMYLHAQLLSVVRRFKDKRFIPLFEVQNVLDGWQRAPYRFLVTRPFCWFPLSIGARVVNSYRVYFHDAKPWLLHKNAEAEFDKVAQWLKAQSKTKGQVERERFQREVIDNFHVAATYHRTFVLVFGWLVAIFIFYLLTFNSEYVLAFNFWIRGVSRAQIIDFYENIMLKEVEVEVPEAYEALYPKTVVKDPSTGIIYLRVVEMVNPETKKRVTLVPFPVIGPRKFYQDLGHVLRNHQKVMIEGASLEALRGCPPAVFFPLKEDLFPILGLHHRFYNVITPGREPPQLAPSTVPSSMFFTVISSLVPLSIRFVYYPELLYGWRSDARLAWGFVKQLTEEKDVLSVVVPWYPSQLCNIGCSLLRAGWTIGNTSLVPWMHPQEPGTKFCDHFGFQ